MSQEVRRPTSLFPCFSHAELVRPRGWAGVAALGSVYIAIVFSVLGILRQ